MPALSTFDASSALAILNEELQRESAPPQAAAGAGVGEDFCRIWPQVKPILETIAGLASFIPGVGAAAGPVLKALVKIADDVAARSC